MSLGQEERAVRIPRMRPRASIQYRYLNSRKVLRAPSSRVSRPWYRLDTRCSMKYSQAYPTAANGSGSGTLISTARAPGLLRSYTFRRSVPSISLSDLRNTRRCSFSRPSGKSILSPYRNSRADTSTEKVVRPLMPKELHFRMMSSAAAALLDGRPDSA